MVIAKRLLNPDHIQHGRDARVTGKYVSFVLAALLILLATDSRVRAADAIRTISTSHYQISTDLDLGFAKELAVRMDAMYDEYSRRFAGVAEPRAGKPLKVYLFAHRADYLRLVGPQYQNTGGLFMPSRGALAAFLEGQSRDGLRRTLQHEAFHQFAYAAMGDRLPPWLNEGLAQIFEEALWMGDCFLLYEVPPRRVRQLEADLQGGRLIDLPVIAKLSPEQWSAPLSDDSLLAAARYNQAWALVQFLVTQRDLRGERYLPRLLSMLQLLHDGHEAAAAFAQAFPDAPQIHRQFLEYAMNLKPTPAAELLERQTVLADLIVELARRGPLPRQMWRVRRLLREGGYQIHYWRGSVRWDSQADVQIYFNDLSNRLYDSNALFFDASDHPIPDIVCRWSERYRFRTRFDFTSAKPVHQTSIELIN